MKMAFSGVEDENLISSRFGMENTLHILKSKAKLYVQFQRNKGRCIYEAKGYMLDVAWRVN